MNDPSRIIALQQILGVTPDGAWGPLSQAAFDALIHPSPEPAPAGAHRVRASSFADPADVAAFRACKARGGSDQECFRVGDNGIGCWGDDVTAPTPYCALPPEDMEERWGSVSAARHQPVLVCANGRTVSCILGDRMPHRAHIANGCGLDLSPAAVAALGLHPPVLIPATWSWA